MDVYRSELLAVTQELSNIEVQLDELLQRQNDLFTRKKELEEILTQSASKNNAQNEQWDKTDYKWSDELQQQLERVFGIQKLRPMQLQTMNVTMSGKDCILIMPTGGGKSLCFHLPALLSPGISLVVSPLVSLMEDQVMALRRYQVDAKMINASTSKEELKAVQQAMIDKNATLKLLYVTPEKLSKSKRFMAQLEKMYKAGRFARLIIDEVHCCSQWGHDFRPDYKFLGIMKRQFPDVPILGLTATATTSVLDDVKKILNIQHCQLFRASFNRPNLFYEVREKPSVQKYVMDDIQQLINSRFPGQSGIVYTFSRKEAEDIAAELQSRGIKAGCYHADLSARERSRVHQTWLNNNIKVVVATVAFGMGIDKPDVRFVIHHSLSKSMENLYQESGRAGRDEKKSHCIVYYRLQDVFRQSCMVMAEQTGLRNLYGIMDYCTNVGLCRRSMIARYFGEVWDSSQCNKMCDHCSSSCTVEKKDITAYCSNVLKIVDNANSLDQKLTAIKLLDAWQGRGPTNLRIKGTETGTDKAKLEAMLAYMLRKDYLKEDFHFTPYSTISYLLSGYKADRLRNNREKVFLELRGKQRTETGTPNSTSKPDLTSSSSSSNAHKSKSDTDKPKPKFYFTDSQKSAFTDSVSSNGDMSKGDKSNKIKKSNSVVKKRKPLIIDSDSDSDGFDFGDNNSKSKKKKAKRTNSSSFREGSSVNGTKSKSSSTSKKRPVIISDDDDGDLEDVVMEGSTDKLPILDINTSELESQARAEVLDSDSDFD